MFNLKSAAIGATMCIAAASLTFGSAHAALMSGDDPVHGVGSITIDTVNNLEWLDLTLSLNVSFNGALAQFGAGGTFEGFRHATAAEILALSNEAGLSLGQSAANYLPAITLQALIGSLGNASPYLGTEGHYDDPTVFSQVGRNDWRAADFVVESMC
jgi:hypothetical protein